MPYPGYPTPPPHYQHYRSPLPHAPPPPPQTPTAQIHTLNPQSSPIDIATPSNRTNKVAQYLDWFIARHPAEVETLMAVKIKLLATSTDMEGIQLMSIEDAKEWGIEWGVGGCLKRNVS